MPAKKDKIIKWSELSKVQQEVLKQNCMTPEEFRLLQTRYGVSAKSILKEAHVFTIRTAK